MKKRLSIILIILLLSTNNTFCANENEDVINDIKYRENNRHIDVSNALENFNADMRTYYGIPEGINYFKASVADEKGKEYELSTEQLTKALDRPDYLYLFVVYGNAHEVEGNDSIYFKGENQPRYLGYNIDVNKFENPYHPFDSWGGWKMTERSYFKEPWKNTNLIGKYQISPNKFCGSKIKLSKPDGTIYEGNLEANIQLGLDTVRSQQTGADLLVNPGNLAGRRFYDAGSKPIDPDTGKEGLWCDFVQVIQPPTYFSWGTGWVFKTDDMHYASVPIAPFMLVKDNLTVRPDLVPSDVYEGTSVHISVTAASEKGYPVKTTARWEGYGDSGVNILDIENSDFVIENGRKSSSINTPELNPGKNTFRFTINSPGNPVPEESNYMDNSVEITINAVPRSAIQGKVILDYDVLSKDFEYPLNRGNNLKAELRLPVNGDNARYSWVGGTTNGSLTVQKSDPGNVLGGFKVDSNPPEINTDNVAVVRSPKVKAVIRREPLGDNPGSKWSDNLADLLAVPEITYDGKVSREYKKEIYTVAGHSDSIDNSTDPPGLIATPVYDWVYDGGGTRDALFNPAGRETITVAARVFNGSPVLPAIQGRKFKEEFADGESSAVKKKIYWISEPYSVLVQRWMKHLDSDGGIKSYEAREGRYNRSFTQQAWADITFKVDNSMSGLYGHDRQNAKNYMPPGAQNYLRVPFASDKEYSVIAYPFKSGYYFNPCGKYSVTIKTLTYKNKSGATQDHAGLINSVKNAFNFSSNLIYTDNGKDYCLNLDKNSSLVNIEVKSKEPVCVEIPHAPGSNGDTHKFFKEILEGWSESGTIGSFDNYKYREYVRDGNLHIYQVTEETTVTFEVNKSNIKLYTDLKMPDGDNYWMKAGFKGFSCHGIGVTGTDVYEKGILDRININVVGSAYNDLYGSDH